MILHLSDWQRYPTAIIDTKTKNQSALRLCEIYRMMGIKNFYFPLALHNPSIQGLDPHSPFLTEEEKILITAETTINPWYYLREVSRLPPVSGIDPVSVILNRGIVGTWWSLLNNVDTSLVQPRQTGKSSGCSDNFMDWLLYFRLENTRINMVTKDNNLRQANVERLKKMRDLLPKYMIRLSKDDADNQQVLTYKATGNSYVTAVARNSEDSAFNVGRGTTSAIAVVDEGPFINFIGTLIPAMLSAGTAAREAAELNGMPYCNLFTHTAGKRDHRDGKYMYNMISGGVKWSETFFDLGSKESFQEMVNTNSTGTKPIIDAVFTHRMLGKSDEWLEKARRNSNSTEDEFKRDFLCEWTSGSLTHPLSAELCARIGEHKDDPLYVEYTPNNYKINWYISEYEKGLYLANRKSILGIDSSDAIGKDSVSFILTDIESLKVIATANISEANLFNLATWVADFLIMSKLTTMIMERKSSGMTLMDIIAVKLMANGIDPFRRIFNHVINDKQERQTDFKEISGGPSRYRNDLYVSYKKDFGFNTNQQSRRFLYGPVLQSAAKNSANQIVDKRLSDEILGLTVKNDRIDHASGGHDDAVVGWLLTHWLITHGKNLTEYGIDPTKVMADIDDGKILTEKELMEKAKQKELREEIERIVGELSEDRHGFQIMRLENKLRTLCAKTRIDGGSEIFNFDVLMQRAEEERREKMVQARTGERWVSGW